VARADKGKNIAFDAYNIGGNNYFKLRDIGAAFDFGVDWDGQRNTIVIDTGKGYTPEKVEYITIKGERYSTSITTLDLSESELTNADIEPLRHMTNLTKLDLYENKNRFVSPLSGLTNLKELYLNSNQISDIGSLSGLPNLTNLWLDGNPLTDAQIAELRAALPDCEIDLVTN
jgi:Leucine-rich repeat (LRR) protein